MKRILSILSVFAVTGMVHAATYFCSPSGNADGLSYATPCSFQSGLNLLSAPGDTLYLRGGQYDLSNTKISNKNGNSTAYIVISGAFSGENQAKNRAAIPQSR